MNTSAHLNLPALKTVKKKSISPVFLLKAALAIVKLLFGVGFGVGFGAGVGVGVTAVPACVSPQRKNGSPITLNTHTDTLAIPAPVAADVTTPVI